MASKKKATQNVAGLALWLAYLSALMAFWFAVVLYVIRLSGI